jgi:hypothetical protein
LHLGNGPADDEAVSDCGEASYPLMQVVSHPRTLGTKGELHDRDPSDVV